MISKLIWKFRVESIRKDIYSILGSSLTTEEKMRHLGEDFSPRLDYIKANLLVNLYNKNNTKRKNNGKRKSKNWRT